MSEQQKEQPKVKLFRETSLDAVESPEALNDYLRAGLGTVEQFLIPYGLEKTGSRHEALAAYGMISAMVFPVLWFPSEIIFALSELMVSELARILAQKNHRRSPRRQSVRCDGA